MKIFRICMFLVALSLLTSVTLASDPGSEADREQILQLERDWTQSWVTMDVAANERILADDFFGTGA